MTDFKTSDRDVNRAIRSWLHEDRHEDVSRIAGAVLDQVETTPQRRATWWPARRTPTMNKFLAIGLGAAAVVVALFVGVQLFGSPDGGTGGQASPTATASRPHAEPTPGADPESGSSPRSAMILPDGRAGSASRRSRSRFRPLTGTGRSMAAPSTRTAMADRRMVPE